MHIDCNDYRGLDNTYRPIVIPHSARQLYIINIRL